MSPASHEESEPRGCGFDLPSHSAPAPCKQEGSINQLCLKTDRVMFFLEHCAAKAHKDWKVKQCRKVKHVAHLMSAIEKTMRKDVKHYVDVLREKIDLVENNSNEDTVEELLEECTCLSDIIEHVMRENKSRSEDARAFSAQRRRLHYYLRSRRGKKAYSRLIETRPLLESAALSESSVAKSGQALLEFHKKLALENIRSKVDEIADINTYIHTAVSSQGEAVDNIAHNIKLDEELSKGTLLHLDSAFRHQRGRNRIYNVFLIGIFLLILMALTFRVMTRI